jgi:hypothetical protein
MVNKALLMSVMKKKEDAIRRLEEMVTDSKMILTNGALARMTLNLLQG